VRYELIINGILADLTDETTVALSKQINLFGDLTNRRADFTSRFTLPKTATNVGIMSRLNLVGNQSTAPYLSATAYLSANGIPICTDGRILATETQGRRQYECVILAGNDSIFKLLEGKYLKDLDTSAVDFTYDHDFFTSLIGSFTPSYFDFGAIQVPVIDSGQGLNPSGATTYPVDIGLEPEYQIPCLLVPYLLRKIFDEAGIVSAYDDSDFFAEDENFLSMGLMLMSPNPELFQDFEAIAIDYDDHTFTQSIAISEYVPFNNIFQDELGTLSIDVAPSPDHIKFTAPNSGRFVFTPYLPMTIINANGWDITHNFGYSLNGGAVVNYYSEVFLDSLSPNTYFLTIGQPVTIQLTVGDTIEFIYSTAISGGAGSYLIGFFENSRINIEPLDLTTFFNQDITASDALPKILQSDFVKMILQMFNLVSQYKPDGSPYFVCLRDVLNGVFGVEDWTSKLIEEKSEKYTIGSYFGLRNDLKYKYTDTDDIFANHRTFLDNENYSDEKTVISSACTASKFDGEEYSYLLATEEYETAPTIKIPYYETLELTNLDEVRLVFLKPILLYDRATGLEEGQFTKGSFVEYYWETLFNQYYREIFTIANRPTVKALTLYLSPVDIYQLDHFKLKYFEQYASFFYLQKVNNFIAGKGVGCEFIQVPPPEADAVVVTLVEGLPTGVLKGFRFFVERDELAESYVITLYDSLSVMYGSPTTYANPNVMAKVVTVTDVYTYEILKTTLNGATILATGSVDYTQPSIVNSWTQN